MTMLKRSLLARGFDKTTTHQGVKGVRVGCSQCDALVINHVACHETGCPNAVHECAGCNNLIPMRQKYCEDCGG
jgi:hypothetical protein